MGLAQFEWDAGKAEANLAKHGVSFEAATNVFADFFAYEELDTESDDNEVRFVITGQSHDAILSVVYTEREDRMRIISARRATKNEREKYYRGQTPQ